MLDLKSGIPAAHTPAWELIDSYEDTDTSTAFDYDSGTLSEVYNIYMVYVELQDYSGSGNPPQLQLNGDTSANYYHAAENGTDYTGETSPDCGAMPANDCAFGYLYIRGGNLLTDPSSPQPSWAGYVTSGSATAQNPSGSLQVAYNDVNRIRIFTSDAATGRLRLYGFNF